jgi:hypothetical protein
MILLGSGSPVSTRFSADEANLVRMKMGAYILFAFSGNPWLQDVATHPYPDVATILAPGARIVDFTGYYLSGPDNPAYEGEPGSLAKPAETYVSWDEKQAEFLPSTIEDWRPWPWPPGVEPCILAIHGSPKEMAFASPDMRELVAPWAVGAWASGAEDLKIDVRPPVDPMVLMCCNAASSRQAMADEVGRLVWAPTGDIGLGAEAISLADASAGVKARVSLYRTEDGHAGRFRSAYPQGQAGDLVRWAYRERFGSGDISWMAEQFAPSGAAAPQAIRPRQIKGGSGRFFGWSFYDKRDWNSRHAAFGPARVGSTYATWVPNTAYRPGTPRQLDPRTGRMLDQAEPWHVNVQATLPFDVDDVMFVAGYFVHDHFVVTDQDDVTYLESPLDFGFRLRRQNGAAVAAGLTRRHVLPRTVVLLTGNDPVPEWAARLVAQGLRDYEVITVSLPATMFLDDHPGVGFPETRVALMPGSSDTGMPVWTRTSPAGVSTSLIARMSSASSRDPSRPANLSVLVPGPRPAVAAGPGPARPQDLIQVRQILQAGTGLTPEVLQSGAVSGTAVLAVRGPIGIDFVGALSHDRWPGAVKSMQADGAFELLAINGEYDPGTLPQIDPVTGHYPLTAWPMLAGSHRALPFDATDNPLYVLVDYYGGYFLLSAKSATSETITMRAESPAEFGRRIRDEIVLAGHEPGNAPASRRPVVLLARHRPVPPQVAAMVARELLNAANEVYTASMPATAYVRMPASATATTMLALIRLPGLAGEPYWTLTTPLGVTSRIDAPPLAPQPTTTAPSPPAAGPSGAPPGGPQPVITDGRAGAGYGRAGPVGPLTEWQQRLVDSLELRPGLPRRGGWRVWLRIGEQAGDESELAVVDGAQNPAGFTGLHGHASPDGHLLLGGQQVEPVDLAWALAAWGQLPAGKGLYLAVCAAGRPPGPDPAEHDGPDARRLAMALPPGLGADPVLAAAQRLWIDPGTGYAVAAPQAQTVLGLPARPDLTGLQDPGAQFRVFYHDGSHVPAPGYRAVIPPGARTEDQPADAPWSQRLQADDGTELDVMILDAQHGTLAQLPQDPAGLEPNFTHYPRTTPGPATDAAAAAFAQAGSGLAGTLPPVSSRSAPSAGERHAESIELTEFRRAPGRPGEAGVSAPPPPRSQAPPQSAEAGRQGQSGAMKPVPSERPSPEPEAPGPDRIFPPLFLERVGGALQYPRGRFGKYVKLGNVLLSDHQALAGLVAGALPPGDKSLRQPLARQVESFLREKGSQAFVQEMLDRGVPFKVHPDGDSAGAARPVTARLGLGDPEKAHQVREPGIGQAPAGQHRSLPWDSEQTTSGGSSRAVTNTRGFSAGPAELATGNTIPSVSVEATSATTHTSTTSTSTSERRFTAGARADVRADVDDAFFRFPEGTLVVAPEGLPGDGEPAGQLLTVLVSFPENLCPLKGWRPLSEEKIGVTQDQVNRDEVVGYDSVHGRDVRASEAAQRIEKLMGRVAAGRESVAGLPQLADDVWAKLVQEVSGADQEHKNDVKANLSESDVLRRWLEIIGQGAVTPVVGRSQHGPRLIIEAGLRNVQALTDDDIPVQEENMRLSAATSATADGGTVSASGTADLRSRATTVTVKGKTASIRGTGELKGTGSLSSTRQQSATISYADVRTVTDRGRSILYRAVLHFTVKIASTGATPEAMPTVERDIVVAIRIPKRQQARFEFLIREALNPAGGQSPSDHEPGDPPSDRYPTAEIASGKGVGFAWVSGTPGAQEVIPRILSMIMNLDRRTPWAQPWTGRAYADAFAILGPDFGTQALVAASIAPIAGLHKEWSRPATEGNELISVRVKVTRGRQPISSGRTANTTFVISSTSGQASGSSGETMMSDLSIEGSGGLEVGYDLGDGRSGSWSVSGGGGLSTTGTAATQAGYSVTRFPILTYHGPALHWDYNLTFAIDVSVRHERGTAPADWVPVLMKATRNHFAWPTPAAGDGEETIPLLTLEDDARLSDHADLSGWVRLGVPEPMAPATPVPQHILDETGAVQVIRNPRRPRNPAADASTWQKAGRHVLPRQLQPRQGQLFRTVPMPDVRHYLGPGGHLRLTGDDRVVEILGADEVGATLKDLLGAGGISTAAQGDLPWKVTEPGQLATSGPSVIMTTVVQDGVITSRHATIKIAGYPTRLPQPAGTQPSGGWRVSDPLVLSSEETDLGGPLVSAMVIKQWAGSLVLGSGLDNGVGRDNVDLNAPVAKYTWSLAPSIRPRTETDTATPGYQIYETRERRRHVEDMVWVITAVFHDKNIAYRSPPSSSAAIVTVRRGILFFRLVDPIPDPRIASGLPPSGIARRIRAGRPALEHSLPPAGPKQPLTGPAPKPAGPQSRHAADTRVVPLMPVTPGSREMIPAMPILPIPSATERLVPLPDPSRPAGVLSQEEPLVELVRRKLAEQAPEHLEDYWTLEAGGLPAERRLPGPLRQLFSLDFIGSISDTVLGGWLTARPTRSLPGSSDVAEIWVSGRRVWGDDDEDEESGYKFLESVPAAEISRDTWRKSIVKAGRPWLFTRSGQTTGQAGPWQSGVQVNPIKQLDKAGGRGYTDAIWDSILFKDGADRYGGIMEFFVVVYPTLQASRAANALLLNIPRHLGGFLQRAGDLSRQPQPGTVRAVERALVARALSNDSALQPVTPPSAAAIEPVPATGTVPGRPLDISAEDLRSGEAASLGWDHLKVQALNSRVLRDLARLEHIYGMTIPWVGSAFEHGATTLLAAANIISYPMFQSYLPEMVDGDNGKEFPTLTRDGGPFTDTSRRLTVHVQFIDPQPGRRKQATRNSSTYHWPERTPRLLHNFGLSAQLRTSLPGNVSLTATAAPSTQRGLFSDVKLMPLSGVQAHTRSVPYQPVSVDALVTVGVSFRNTRGMIDVPSRPRARLRYRVRNALVLLLSPKLSVKHNLRSPEDILHGPPSAVTADTDAKADTEAKDTEAADAKATAVAEAKADAKAEADAGAKAKADAKAKAAAEALEAAPVTAAAVAEVRTPEVWVLDGDLLSLPARVGAVVRAADATLGQLGGVSGQILAAEGERLAGELRQRYSAGRRRGRR